jgi:hypothetical protein
MKRWLITFDFLSERHAQVRCFLTRKSLASNKIYASISSDLSSHILKTFSQSFTKIRIVLKDKDKQVQVGQFLRYLETFGKGDLKL